MNNIVIDNVFINPKTSVRYCTWSDESPTGREESLFKNGDLFYLEKSEISFSNSEYQSMNVSEVQTWLDGKEITVHVDETLFTEDLQLSRTLKPVSDDTPAPPDDSGFDFGGGEDNQASVTLEITA